VGGIQLFAPIKIGLKFFQQKKLMRTTIIAEEELAHKVLSSFKDNFSMSGSGRSLDVLKQRSRDNALDNSGLGVAPKTAKV
jgi:hypothetical protein